MKNLTISITDDILTRARVMAAQDGKSLSRVVSELVERRVARARTQRGALDAFLSGPTMTLTDENGKAPRS